MATGFCPQCGIQRTGELRYCATCGFDFWKAAEPQAKGDQPAATAAQPMATAVSGPQPANVSQPRSVGRRWTGSTIGLLGAGGALIIAPFLPFITATAAFVGSITRSGVELVGVEAFLLCLFGGLLVATGIQRSGGKPIGRALPIVASLGAAALTAWYFSQVSERVDSVGTTDGAIASIGVGMWLAVGGSLVGFLVAIRRPDEPWL